MKLIKRAIRAYQRIDRLTGKVRDTTIKGIRTLVKAYRKRNGQRVRAHRRNVIAADLQARGKPVVRRKRQSNGATSTSNRQRRPRATSRTAAR